MNAFTKHVVETNLVIIGITWVINSCEEDVVDVEIQSQNLSRSKAIPSSVVNMFVL